MPFVIRFFLLFAVKLAINYLLRSGNKMTDDYVKKVIESPIAVIVTVPIIEELLFRWLPIYFGATSIFGWLMLSSSILFAVAHLPNFNGARIKMFIKYFLIACIYAWVAINWGVFYAILMHMMNNAIAYYSLMSKLKQRYAR